MNNCAILVKLIKICKCYKNDETIDGMIHTERNLKKKKESKI